MGKKESIYRSKSVFAFIALVCFLGFHSSTVWADNEKLVFATFPEGTPFIGSVELLLKTVYKNLGYDIQVLNRPSRRALRDSNTGHIDGELIRTSFIEGEYDELVRVSFPIVNIDTYAYSFDEHMQNVYQWSDLNHWNVGTVRGARVFELETPGIKIMGNDFKHLLQLLMKERIDAMVSFEVKGRQVPSIREVAGKELHRSKLLGSYSMYHYLHRKHAGLAERVAEQLALMEANGVLNQIYRQQGINRSSP